MEEEKQVLEQEVIETTPQVDLEIKEGEAVPETVEEAPAEFIEGGDPAQFEATKLVKE